MRRRTAVWSDQFYSRLIIWIIKSVIFIWRAHCTEELNWHSGIKYISGVSGYYQKVQSDHVSPDENVSDLVFTTKWPEKLSPGENIHILESVHVSDGPHELFSEISEHDKNCYRKIWHYRLRPFVLLHVNETGGERQWVLIGLSVGDMGGRGVCGGGGAVYEAAAAVSCCQAEWGRQSIRGKWSAVLGDVTDLTDDQ